MKTQNRKITFPCIKVKQPIGEFFIASIDCKTLQEITFFDVRRIEKEREIETYLGIQRPLIPKRVKEIQGYVETIDSCFPTSVILAVDGVCAEFNGRNREMTLKENLDKNRKNNISFQEIARVLDGQHRIEGLKEFTGKNFEVNVSIFVDIDIDIAEQAYIFSTVNLAQTKVNRSLAYDLFGLAKARSPQKVCHNISVALDQEEGSPFFHRIKRLGVATEGRFGETLTQATFVQALMNYISQDEMRDRDLYKKNKTPKKADAKNIEKLIFRNMMIEKRDYEITDIIWNYFDAVKERWEKAWEAGGRGIMLNKTNGFKGLMRFLRTVYLYLVSPGEVPSKKDFFKIFNKISLKDNDFDIERFKPGTSGESELYRTLLEKSKIPE